MVRCWADGFVVMKESSANPDGTAKIYHYLTIRHSGPFFNIQFSNGQTQKFDAHRVSWYSEKVDISTRNITQHDLPLFTEMLRSYETCFKRFPRLRDPIKEQLAIIRDTCVQLRSGNAHFRGKWMKEREMVAIQEKEKNDRLATMEGRLKEKEIAKRRTELDRLIKSQEKTITSLKEKIDALTEHQTELEESNSFLSKNQGTAQSKANSLLRKLTDKLKLITP